MTANPYACEIGREVGYDIVVLDMEHGTPPTSAPPSSRPPTTCRRSGQVWLRTWRGRTDVRR
jgi:hypothetical protein